MTLATGPEPVQPAPSPPGAALDLLADNIAHGATVVAIGAYTNLALLEITRPGILDGVRVVVMGGWIDPPAADLPQWGPDMDWNTRCDTRAAEILLASEADLSMVTLPVTMHAAPRDRPSTTGSRGTARRTARTAGAGARG